MQPPAPFIDQVRLKNYKSIAACDVALSPLTVLIGPNGSGKSNFVDALAFLARALETTLYTAVDERGGLPELVRRVPYPEDSFAIDVDVTFRWGKLPVTGSYGLEIGRNEGVSFQVIRETCALDWPGATAGWERDSESVRGTGSSAPIAVVEPDRLYLPVAASQLPVAPEGITISTPFTTLSRGLAGMQFYSLGLDELRQLRPTSADTVLGRRGEHLADVIGALEKSGHKERLEGYLSALLGASIPEGVRIEQWFAGHEAGTAYTLVQLHSPTGVDGRDVVFSPQAMSDGTLRAVGVLAALFQPAAFHGRVKLVGIEEPETALHPAAIGVIHDALTEASEHVQVIATSQSADLLDRDDLDVSAIRPVTMEHGLTVIAGVDSASRKIVADRLFTLGELMRGNQISPEAPPADDDQPRS
jgi:energy-coupling factor transporter ATP-binding protein EcfA2